MRSFLNIALYRFKSFYRDRFTFFFSLLLPIIFVIIFGFVFGGSNRETGKIKIGVLSTQNELAETIEEIPGIEVQKLENIEMLREFALKGKIDAGILFEENKLKVLLNFSSYQQKPFLRTLGETITSYYSKKEVGLGKLIEIEEENIEIGKQKISYLGYTIPGVVSFSLATAIFTMISLFGYYRKRGILKRFAVTPVNPFIFISGMTMGNFFAILISSTFVLIFSQLLFNLKFTINWGLYFTTSASTILGMMSIGIVLTALFKEPNTANNVGNLIMNIMLFFSGVYFPLDFLPQYLKNFAKILPLYYVGRALRISVGVEEGSNQFVFNTALVMVFSFIILILIFGRKILETEK